MFVWSCLLVLFHFYPYPAHSLCPNFITLYWEFRHSFVTMIASRTFEFNHILQDYTVDWDYSSRMWEWKPLFTYIRENRLFKTSCWESPPPPFFKEYFKKNNKSSNYYWIYLDVGISKLWKSDSCLQMQATFCCCSDAAALMLLLVFTLGK